MQIPNFILAVMTGGGSMSCVSSSVVESSERASSLLVSSSSGLGVVGALVTSTVEGIVLCWVWAAYKRNVYQ